MDWVLLPLGVALFVLPLVMVAIYARRIEKRQRKIIDAGGSLHDELRNVA
jgi:hypothetical protein